MHSDGTTTKAPAGAPAHLPFRPDIEGLRALAVVLVVLFHARVPGFSGGFVGVDVFFVLSGYLITRLLAEEMERTGRIDLPRFYARRVRRLLPASALMIAAVLIAGFWLLAPLEQAQLGRTAAASALYASNILFMRSALSYFAPTAEGNPLLHTWSLAVEEQFYLVWPLLILLAMRGGRPARKVATALALLSLVSLAGSVWLTGVSRPWAFFGAPARAWEFGLGALASFVPEAALRARAAWMRTGGWLGLCAIVGAAVVYTEMVPYPGIAAVLPTAGTAAVLLAGAAAPGAGIGWLLNLPAMQRLGALSYSWYLWHWPVLVFTLVEVPGLGLAGRLACLAASLAIAGASYSLVENPVRFSPRLSLRPARSLVLGALLTIGGAAAGWGAYRTARIASGAPPYARFTAAAADEPRLARTCIAAPAATGLTECVSGDRTATSTIVLLGDSHAAQWHPALESIARREGIRLVTLLKASCPATDVAVHSRELGRAYRECTEWRRKAFRRVSELRPGVVVIGNSSRYVRRAGEASRIPRLAPEEWGAGARRTLDAMVGTGARVVWMHDTPFPGFDVPQCLSRAVRLSALRQARCDSPRARAVHSSAVNAERRAAAGLSQVRLVDFVEHFCGATVCPAIRGEFVLYRDTNHITARYALHLAGELERAMPAL